MYTRREQGLTLIESAGVIVIIGAVAVFAIPSITKHMNRNNLKSHTQAVHDLVRSARQISLKAEHPIVLCSTQSQHACSAGNWNEGLMAFVDTNDNARYDSEDELIGIVSSAENGINVKYSGFPYKTVHVFSNNDKINSNGSFVLSHTGTDTNYRLAISKTGHSHLRYN